MPRPRSSPPAATSISRVSGNAAAANAVTAVREEEEDANPGPAIASAAASAKFQWGHFTAPPPRVATLADKAEERDREHDAPAETSAAPVRVTRAAKRKTLGDDLTKAHRLGIAIEQRRRTECRRRTERTLEASDKLQQPRSQRAPSHWIFRSNPWPSASPRSTSRCCPRRPKHTVLPRKSGPPVSPKSRIRITVVSGYLG